MDIDWDGEPDPFNLSWLENLLEIPASFGQTNQVPMAVNEFGANRWLEGAAEFMNDEMNILEQNGWNYALWVWDPAWSPWTENVNALNFRFGSDPDNVTDTANDLQDVITSHWSQNTLRPSNWQEIK